MTTAPDLPALPVRWYSVSREGMATLCVDEADARRTAKKSDAHYPQQAPHVAVQLGDVAARDAEIARLRAKLKDCGGDNCMGQRVEGVTQWITEAAAEARVSAALAAQQPAAVQITDDMARAYLAANTAYWRAVDESVGKPGVWRNGTPHEATLEGLRAALAAAPAVQPPTMKPWAWARVSNISHTVRGVFQAGDDGSAPDVELKTERMVPLVPPWCPVQPTEAKEQPAEAVAVLRDLTELCSQHGDHTAESFWRGCLALSLRAHKVLAAPTVAPSAQPVAPSTWSAYVADMIAAYLKWPVDDPRADAIAGIIERRLKFLPRETQPVAGIEDPVTVPRGLLGAACAAIRLKHDAPKTIAQLRYYTFGDLPADAAAPSAPQQTSGHCTRGNGCVCGGDTDAVREACRHWQIEKGDAA